MRSKYTVTFKFNNMKILIFTISLAVNAFFMQAQVESAPNLNGTTITVTIPTKSDEGTINLGLYTEDIFMKAAPAKSMHVQIKEGKAVAIFENVEPGIYAIALYQDKNSNNTMDFQPNGMPSEPYGTSNNIMSYGPPQWSDAKFIVEDQPIEMEIRL